MNNKGFIAIISVVLLSIMAIMLFAFVDLSKPVNELTIIKTILANRWKELGINDALYVFQKNKNNFFGKLNWCDQINGAIPSQYSWENTSFTNNSSNIFDLSIKNTLSSSFLLNNNYPNSYWFLNRDCSIYSNSYPQNWNQNYIIPKDIVNVIDFPEEYIYIKSMDRDTNKGFLFTKNLLLDKNWAINTENFPIFKVWYNLLSEEDMSNYNNIDYLKNSPTYSKILKLMESDWLETTKENIEKYFFKDLFSTADDAKIEIWLVAYSWSYDSSISDFKIDNKNATVIQRNLCDWGLKWVCSIDLKTLNIPLQNDNLYFFYIKTLDKSTNISYKLVDQFWEKINFISWDLKIDLFWNNNQFLVHSSTIKENIIWSDLSSWIFNYLYYSQN